MDLQKLAQKTIPETYKVIELTTCLKDASIKYFYQSGKSNGELQSWMRPFLSFMTEHTLEKYELYYVA